MQLKCNSLVLSAFFLLFVTQACHADLMCYECTNCARIKADTPKVTCNAAYFEQQKTTEIYSTSTGTLLTTPISSTTASLPGSTTTVNTSSGSMETTRPSDTTMYTPPSPPTVGPIRTTSPLPTPPNVTDYNEVLHIKFTGEETNVPTTLSPNQDFDRRTTSGRPLVQFEQPSNTGNNGFLQNEQNAQLDQLRPLSNAGQLFETSSMQSSTVGQTTEQNNDRRKNETLEQQHQQQQQVIANVRQRRDTASNTIYQCYSVKRNDNGILITDRGCASTTTMQSVCKKLEMEYNGTKFNKCSTCGKSLCNASSAVSSSIVLLILATIATFLRLK